MTANGRIILDVINHSYSHPTAEQIDVLLRNEGHRMSRATVYNNLCSLLNEGAIRRLSIPGQPDRYDKMLRHDHIVCLKCGRIKDVFLNDRFQELSNESGEEIVSYDLRLFDICEDCRSEEPEQ